MNVLVIGGSGLFGRKTVLKLLEDKDIASVVSMDVAPPPAWILQAIEPNAARFTFCRGDISQLEDVLDVMKRHRIERLVNLAFLLPVAVEASPRLAVKVNELGMCNAFEAARLLGVGRVVYASSEGVYGPQNFYGDRDVTEDDLVSPRTAYAVAKQLAEMLAKRYGEQYGIAFSALRPPIVYGHGGATPEPVRWFSEVVSLPAVGQPFVTEMDGKSQHSLAMADDVAELIRRLIKAPSSPHPVYNVGGPPESLRQVAEVVRGFIPDAQIEFGSTPVPGKPGEMGIPWRLDTSRAKQDFGFSCLPREEAVRIHINDARAAAGLPRL